MKIFGQKTFSDNFPAANFLREGGEWSPVHLALCYDATDYADASSDMLRVLSQCVNSVLS